MLENGIVLSPDFRNLGDHFDIIHGTSTKSGFGNLSQIRDSSPDFRERYVSYLNTLRVNPQRAATVISPVTHSSNVAFISSHDWEPGIHYADIESSFVNEIITGKKNIPPPNMSDDQQLIGFDAMLTQSKNVYLGLAHADCAPVFVMYPYYKAVAMIHVGILGFLSDILGNTFAQANTWFGAKPTDAIVFIGPCISRSSYNVRRSGMWEPVLKYHMTEEQAKAFDLKESIRRRLQELGVRLSAIYYTGYCTAEHSDLFFSNHKAPMAEKASLGRNLSLIGMRY